MENFKQRAKELVSKMTLAEKCAQMRHDAPAIEHLGVPAYNWWNECLHGVARSGCATVFPQAIGLAASFNTELMHTVATAISDEARAKYNEYKKFGDTGIYQGLTHWSPNINIFRDPRWGRGHETYGEDPYLTGEMGVAFIKGLQGYDPTYRKIDATIKHYAVHSGPEKERHEFNAIASDKDLYETYFWAFKYCIDNAKPAAVMGAYNRINGEPACASPKYLKGVLYGEFGFDGYVVSDFGGICDINLHHKITANEAESAALAINNGCQLNCGDAYKWVKTAVVSGLLTEETITEAVEKLFETRFKLGMFDNDCVYDKILYDIIECDEHRKLNRKMAQESIVLLKNDGVLPLGKDIKTIAVMGPNSDEKIVLLGNYNGTPSVYSTMLKGIQDGTDAKIYYADGCNLVEERVTPTMERNAIIAAQKSDVVIMCMGLSSLIEGEEGDAYNFENRGDKKSIELPLPQRRLLDAISKTGTPIVFLNITGSCLDLIQADEACNAVLQVFYPGAEGGNAVADILFGKANPSGKLPITMYKSDEDLPGFWDYSMKNRTYRFYEGEPLYKFGHGLSYSTFKYDNINFASENLGKNDDIEISLTVSNTGTMDGQEVVEVYLKHLDTPLAIRNGYLAAFEKIAIPAGGNADVTIKIPPYLQTVVDENGKRFRPPGRLQIKIGDNEFVLNLGA